jgi:hypothetical protein
MSLDEAVKFVLADWSRAEAALKPGMRSAAVGPQLML